MKLTPEEKLTVATYDTNAQAWIKKHSTPGIWDKEMAIFKKLLPKGEILEIGAGGGRDAKELIALGYDYAGVDVSRGLLVEAQKLNPQAQFFHQSIYELDFLKYSFDGFWTAATLLHIPKSRINEALKKIHAIVRPNGIGFISVKQGRGEKIELDEPQLPGERKRLFSYYSQDEFRKILIQNGYQIIKSYLSSIIPMSQGTTWLIYFVKVVK